MHVQIYIEYCLKLALFRMRLLRIDHVWPSFRRLHWNSTILVALLLSYITLLNTVFPPRPLQDRVPLTRTFSCFFCKLPWNGRPWWTRSLMQSLIFLYQRLCEFTLTKCSDNLISGTAWNNSSKPQLVFEIHSNQAWQSHGWNWYRY